MHPSARRPWCSKQSPLSNRSTGSTIVASLSPIGNVPPAEAEERYYAQLEEIALAA
jgi:hypothetical protein